MFITTLYCKPSHACTMKVYSKVELMNPVVSSGNSYYQDTFQTGTIITS